MESLSPRYLLLLILLAPMCTSSCTAGLRSRVLEPEAEYFEPAVRVYFDTGKDDPDELDVFKDGSLTAAVDFLGISFPFLAKKGAEDADVDAHLAAAEAAVKAAKDRQAAVRSAARARTEPNDGRRGESDQRVADLEVADREKTLRGAKQVKNRARGHRLDGDWIVGPRLAVGLTAPAGDSSSGTDTATGAPVVYVSAGIFADFNKGGTLFDDDGVGIRLEFGWLVGFSTDENLADSDDTGIYVGMSAFL